jgi:hypothetical protein
MLITICLAILFSIVITCGIISLTKGMKKENLSMTNPTCLKELKDIKDQSKYVGGSMIGVGAIGLFIVCYMAVYGHPGSKKDSNFGFKFY